MEQGVQVLARQQPAPGPLRWQRAGWTLALLGGLLGHLAGCGGGGGGGGGDSAGGGGGTSGQPSGPVSGDSAGGGAGGGGGGGGGTSGQPTGPITLTVQVTGLLGGRSVLLHNGTDALEVLADGQTSFATPLPVGLAYTVRVDNQPYAMTCTVANSSGKVQNPQAAVAVDCAPNVRVTSLIGKPGNNATVDGQGVQARFSSPVAMASDAIGNLYVVDPNGHVVRKVTPDGYVSTLAGNPSSTGNQDGKGATAYFDHPCGVVVDADRNVYVTDAGSSTVRRVTPNGTVSTLAGKAYARGSVDGTGSDARFYSPCGIAMDSEGRLYVADIGNNTIRQVLPNGSVTTWAGVAGSTGSSDGPRLSATFKFPFGLAFDSQRRLIVSEQGVPRLRRIDTDGQVSTLRRPDHGTTFQSPNGIAVDIDDSVLVADDRVIYRVQPDGTVSTWAGRNDNTNFDSVDGDVSTALFFDIGGLHRTATGHIIVADAAAGTLRQITQSGQVSTLAGAHSSGGYADGTGEQARLALPTRLARGSGTTMFLIDRSNNALRQVDWARGTTMTLTPSGFQAMPSSTYSPTLWIDALATGPDGKIYLQLDDGVHRISVDGRTNTLMGQVTGTDGLPTRTKNMVVGADGTVFYLVGKTVRRLNTDGSNSTVASAPGTASANAGYREFRNLAGLAVASNGDLVVADVTRDGDTWGPFVLHRISPNGSVREWARVVLRHPGPYYWGTAVFMAFDDQDRLFLTHDMANPDELFMVRSDGHVFQPRLFTLEGAARLLEPRGLTWAGGALYLSTGNAVVALWPTL